MGLIVWVTRAQPGADATAQTLRQMGHQPVVAPLLAIRPLPAVVDLAGIAALAFTSANGVEAYGALSPDRALPVYAVGDATAQAARLAGFRQVGSAEGDVDALAALIATDRPRGRVLAPGALQRAGDLQAALTAAGVESETLAVYETLALAPPPELDPEAIDLALVHSPKAARALAAFLAQHPAPDLAVCCISLAAAAPLAATPLAALDAASHPTEAALLALI